MARDPWPVAWTRSLACGINHFGLRLAGFAENIFSLFTSVLVTVAANRPPGVTGRGTRVTNHGLSMRIKIIGENDCARATRHLLRLAGFAVTDFLPAGARPGPSFFRASSLLAGYAITIELAPAHHTPDGRRNPDSAGDGAHSRLGPDLSAQQPHASAKEEASHAHSRSHRDASSPAFVPLRGTTAGAPASLADREAAARGSASDDAGADQSAEAPPNLRSEARIHFDSAESALEAAVLRHVTQLAAAPVILDRPGGVVHSDRELRIVAPNTGDARVDEAAAVAIEFGVLRGLLDLTGTSTAAEKEPAPGKLAAFWRRVTATGKNSDASVKLGSAGGKKWWPLGIVFFALLCSAGVSPALKHEGFTLTREGPVLKNQRPARWQDAASMKFRVSTPHTAGETPALRLHSALALDGLRLVSVALAPWTRPLATADPAQGQFVTGQGIKITDGTNFLAVDPCAAQLKSYASINQTADTELVAGTASKKVYVCSIHVVAAAAANIAVVEGTGTVCGTGTAGVSGFGGASAATGWNFAANGGLTLGSGESSVGAEGTSGDNLCIFNSGSGQVSGGISYVVQ